MICVILARAPAVIKPYISIIHSLPLFLVRHLITMEISA